MITVVRKSSFGAAVVVLITLLFAGCAQQLREASPRDTQTAPGNPERAEAQGDYARAAELYMQAANKTADPEARRRLRFEAGLAAAQAGNTAMAQQILSSLTPSTLNEVDRARYNLARREIEIASLPPARALEQLPPPSSGTAPVVAERVWEKRAQLHFEQNDLISGIDALVQRGVWLVDDAKLAANDARIYDRALDAIALGQGPNSPAAARADRTTLGWLALAEIGQRRWPNRRARDSALAQWEENYPRHPATRSILWERFDYRAATSPMQREPGRMMRGEAPRPQSNIIALAVPLTGNFANAARAIRDGFMFAYENDTSTPARPLVYDTQMLSASALLQKAQSDGVGILVGPLDKPKVAEMARLNSRIPTIGLNYSDEPHTRPGFYQFALAPEDEAREVARHAYKRGHSRGLVLVPDSDWGSRVFDAFRDGFEQRGGQVVDYATYRAEEPDHRQPIQALLRSRGAADFIFVAAQPDQARLIRSQLRYYRAASLPMLTTSHAYTGTADPGNDIDLNGVEFADMPWVVGEGDYISARRDDAEQRYGTTAKHYKRLFAMGMDAWRLADRIAAQGLKDGDVFEGMTGVLKLKPDGAVRRYLAWAVFEDGEARLVEMPSVEAARSDREQPRDPWARP